MLLLGHVFLVVDGGDAVLVGELGHADPVAGWRAVRGRGGWWGAGLLLGLAQPQQDGPKDEDSPGRDADDDGPGQAAGRGRGHRCAGRFGIWMRWQGRDRKSSLNAGKGDSKRCHTRAGCCTGCLATLPDQVTREKSSQHMMFGNCFAFQCSWKDKQLIFSCLGVRRGVFGGFYNSLIQALMDAH